jgi:hypothetical protein
MPFVSRCLQKSFKKVNNQSNVSLRRGKGGEEEEAIKKSLYFWKGFKGKCEKKGKNKSNKSPIYIVYLPHKADVRSKK